MRKFFIALAASLLVIAACGESPPAAGSGAGVVDTEDETEEVVDDDAEAEDESTEVEEEPSEAAEEESVLGTRDNPLDIGTTIEMGVWVVTVADVNPDATDEVLEENQFNDPPAEGRQFVMFHVEATYEGDDSGDPWLDFAWAIVGGAGNTFGTGMDDWCGSIPNPLDDQGETYPGGSVSGNVCVSVASDQLEGATIRIEEAFSFDDTRAFYGLD
jgi:hypothetical protein